MSSSLVSVIIPLYNQSRYILDCLRSVSRQSYENVEIIVIDDASTDDSLATVRGYAEGDRRVRVLSANNNKGVSYARNRGMRAARGEYITFVDSDDILSEKYVEELFEALRVSSHASIAVCGVIDPGKLLSVPRGGVRTTVITGNKCLKSMLSRSGVPDGPWAKLFKKVVIQNLRFDESLRYCEDVKFNYLAIKEVDNVVVVSAPLYGYRDNQTGASRSGYNRNRMDGLRAVKDVAHDAAGLTTEVARAAGSRVFMEAVYILGSMKHIKSVKDRNECIGAIRQYRVSVLRSGDVSFQYKIYALISYVSIGLALRTREARRGIGSIVRLVRSSPHKI